jgi:hypothetical protein
MASQFYTLEYFFQTATSFHLLHKERVLLFRFLHVPDKGY